MMADVQGGGLFSRAVLLQVATGRFSVRRKVSDLGAVDVDCDKSRLHIAAELLTSAELDAIYSFDGATRRYLMSRALPVSLVAPGVYVMPLASVEELDAYLSIRADARLPLVDAFCDVYAGRADAGRLSLGVLGDASMYPPVEVVRRAFRMGFSWFSLGAPGLLEGIRADLFARERAKLESSFSEALTEAREALRAMAAGLVDHLLERLAPGADGRRKRFEASTVEKLVEWCDTFNARNLADDEALAAEVAKIRMALSGVTADDLRGSAFARRDVSLRLGEVKGALDSLLSDSPVRFFAAREDVSADVQADPAGVV